MASCVFVYFFTNQCKLALLGVEVNATTGASQPAKANTRWEAVVVGHICWVSVGNSWPLLGIFRVTTRIGLL